MKTLHLPGSEVCTTANYDENLADKKRHRLLVILNWSVCVFCSVDIMFCPDMTYQADGSSKANRLLVPKH